MWSFIFLTTFKGVYINDIRHGNCNNKAVIRIINIIIQIILRIVFSNCYLYYYFKSLLLIVIVLISLLVFILLIIVFIL